MSDPTELLWVDCEMTGLDLSKDCIIEYAAIVTDAQLVPLDEGISFVVKADQALLDSMDDWCTKQHGESGLTKASLECSTTLCTSCVPASPLNDAQIHTVETAAMADRIATDYARKHIPAGRILLAGSSVHVDKAFLKKDFPTLSTQLHYRVLDVSTIKEVVRRWYPQHSNVCKSNGESAHRALDDIRASINELKRYRSHFFNKDVQLPADEQSDLTNATQNLKLKQ